MKYETCLDRIFVALDVPSADDARRLVETLGDDATSYKIGLQLFTAAGPGIVKELADAGKNVFLDLKFFDIPNTVAGAVKSVISLGADIINVHCSGGEDMMHAAHQAAVDSGSNANIIGVTVLTSMDQEDLNSLAIVNSVERQVVHYAYLAQKASLSGVVCSPQEIELLREEMGNDFMLITPGIRPKWAATGDQKRIMTPGQAMAKGATALVIGRPITAAKNPADAMRRILDEC
jgi:orotidine-5'-phosphate decarboxylase